MNGLMNRLMNRLFCKTFNTVVMDASDESVMRNITDSIDIVTRERCGKSISRPFDGDHPTMKVIVTRTSKRTYKTVQEMIERAYPGLCVFSAIM